MSFLQCPEEGVRRAKSVVEVFEPAECDSSDPTKIQIRWSAPHPTNGEDPTGTFLLYVLFVINDNKPEWTKLAMVSFSYLFVMCRSNSLGHLKAIEI